MADLDTKARDKLRASQFAYVDKAGEEHLPINDASHVRNAIARFNQTEFESKAAKERARRKILAAAKRYDIELSADDIDAAHRHLEPGQVANVADQEPEALVWHKLAQLVDVLGKTRRIDESLDDDSEVRPGAQRFREMPDETPVLHPDAKPPAGHARLRYLEDAGPNLPALADERLVHLHPFRCEVLAELPGLQRSAHFPFPPSGVFDRIGVHGLVRPSVRFPIRLVVALEIHPAGGDATDDG